MADGPLQKRYCPVQQCEESPQELLVLRLQQVNSGARNNDPCYGGNETREKDKISSINISHQHKQVHQFRYIPVRSLQRESTQRATKRLARRCR